MKYYNQKEKSELEIKEYPFLCKICKKEKALVEISSQKIKVCKNCYNNFFENRIKKTIEKYKMIKQQNKVGVFFSGGKDSSTLLFVLKKLYPDINLHAIFINLGIRYYSEKIEDLVKSFCKSLEIPLFIYNLLEREGYRIDDFIFTHFKNKVCSACGAIKRYLFSKIAKELELNVIATGHHLDDIISTMLTLFFQGDFLGIAKLQPSLPPLFPNQIKKIKPLYTTPEKEIFYYALLNEIPFENFKCPHADITPPKKIKKLLTELEKENRQIKYQLLSVFTKRLIPLIKSNYKEESFSLCIKCEEITSAQDKICSRCKRVELLKKLDNKTLELTKEEFENYIKNLNSNWVLIDLENKESLLNGSTKKLKKFFNLYKNKYIYLKASEPEIGYLFTLKLRKLGFKAYNIKNA
uniref:TIGR00269 family protein n=1 Tax=Thermodesulfobacterium geofontis TaxID=1295609 RepID=A0A7V4N3C4_9BACT